MKHGIDQYMYTFQWDADTLIQIPDVFVYSIPILFICWWFARASKRANKPK